MGEGIPWYLKLDPSKVLVTRKTGQGTGLASTFFYTVTAVPGAVSAMEGSHRIRIIQAPAGEAAKIGLERVIHGTQVGDVEIATDGSFAFSFQSQSPDLIVLGLTAKDAGTVPGDLPISQGSYKTATTQTTFDFGTPTSPVEVGYTQVIPSSTPGTGKVYGWRQGDISALDRGPTAGTALTRDFNSTREGTFAVALDPGFYEVSVAFGVYSESSAADQSATLYFEGRPYAVAHANLNDPRHPGNQRLVKTFLTQVSDGQLDLRLAASTALRGYAYIESLQIRVSDRLALDFSSGYSTVSSLYPLSEGFAPAEVSPYTAAAGYGWLNPEAVTAFPYSYRWESTHTYRHFVDGVKLADASFRIDLPPGDYLVNLDTGVNSPAAAESESIFDVYFQDTFIDMAYNPDTSTVRTHQYPAHVGEDRRLKIHLVDRGESPGRARLQAISLQLKPKEKTKFSTFGWSRKITAMESGFESLIMAFAGTFSLTDISSISVTTDQGVSIPYARQVIGPGTVRVVPQFHDRMLPGTYQVDVRLTDGQASHSSFIWNMDRKPIARFQFGGNTPSAEPELADATWIKPQTVYTEAIHHGWSNECAFDGSRIPSTADLLLLRFFQTGVFCTFVVDLPPGEYDVGLVFNRDRTNLPTDLIQIVLNEATAGYYSMDTFTWEGRPLTGLKEGMVYRVKIDRPQLRVRLGDRGGNSLAFRFSELRIWSAR